MNLEYLKKEIIPQREKEIEEGKNASTRQPIYIVYDVIESCTTRDTEYSNLEDCNLYGYRSDVGRYETEDEEEYEFVEDYENGDISRFYIDRLVAIFLTRKGAEKYLKYQKHNLTSKAYIYTHYSGYANQEMDNLLENK